MIPDHHFHESPEIGLLFVNLVAAENETTKHEEKTPADMSDPAVAFIAIRDALLAETQGGGISKIRWEYAVGAISRG